MSAPYNDAKNRKSKEERKKVELGITRRTTEEQKTNERRDKKERKKEKMKKEGCK